MNKKNKLIVAWTLIITVSFVLPFYGAYIHEFTFEYFCGLWAAQFIIICIFGLPIWLGLVVWYAEKESERGKLEYNLRNMKNNF